MSDIDINKAMTLARHGEDLDEVARAQEIANWSRETAAERAKAEGLELTQDHWRVIEMLQALYVEGGQSDHARDIANTLNNEFAADGGSKFLFRLFPGGPVAQGSRIAGVPAPHDASDPSFGSTF